ncbi:sugar ABC transporter [Chimaeribacter californicus]|uniref:Sugar ABC transporter n=1 Tax=Chimaeribacter californicus TaxID=2060067 RepID=A0A2N5DW92_9GAMM|nr:sugar ABC transporter ATP-binding protein [Chimaeribacter californicus]PLR31448.1 sugar ABC transporter [Chimaeribacter californicus]
MASNTPLLALHQIDKAFDGVPALRQVSLVLAAGEIHGLIGHNGAGKSTLIKILGGLQPADGGQIWLDGRQIHIDSPGKARALGIEIVHQERLLAPTLTVAETLLSGEEPVWPGLRLINRRRLRHVARQAIQHYFGLDINPDSLIADLSVAEQQIVQITRALRHSPRVLVFDEPTAALARHEVTALFKAIRRLREQGLAVLYVSHYLDEISELCQQVSVLRDGRNVAQHTVSTVTPHQLIHDMLGNALREGPPRQSQRREQTLLQVTALSAEGRFREVSFSARSGEILGITGLLGSGGKALVRALFGLESGLTGTIILNGRPLLPRTPHQAVKQGIAFVPEDRRANGIAPALSVRENIALTSLTSLVSGLFIDRRREQALVAGNIERLGIRTPGMEAPLRALSGGNQQKVVLAKWLNTDAWLYLLDEPTVGVDIGAKAEIYQALHNLAAEGAVIIVFSADLLELQSLCDRILVMARGKLVKTLDAAATDHHELLAWASGAVSGTLAGASHE